MLVTRAPLVRYHFKYICIVFLLLIYFSYPVMAASTGSSTWSAPDMPDWAIPLAFGILFAVYTLIVFEIVHRALAAAVGGIAAVISLHYIGYTLKDWIF